MRKILLLASTLLLSIPSYATFYCSVDIDRILIYGNGDVNIRHSGRGDYTVICNLNSPRKDVGITTCAMWASMLQNLKGNEEKAIFAYPGTGTCTELKTYGHTQAPLYIGVL